MSEVLLPKRPSVEKLDTLDSLTYHQENKDPWHSFLKSKKLPTDVYRIVGITTFSNLRFKCTDYFFVDSWKELRELNRAFKEAGLWYYQRDFLNRSKRLLEDFSYSLEWCSLNIYFPKRMSPLIICPESIFLGTNMTPVILVAPRLQPLDRATIDALKEEKP
jgi:hypothetical protein